MMSPSTLAKRAVKRVLSVVFPEFRNGNIYALDANRGWLKIYRFGSPRTIVVVAMGSMIWIETAPKIRAAYYSHKALKSIVATSFVGVVGQLNPVAISMFVRSRQDSRGGKTAMFPSLAGVEMPLSIRATQGGRAVVLDRDFGGFFHFFMEVLPALIRLRESALPKVLVKRELGDKYPFVAQLLDLYRIDHESADDGAWTISDERVRDSLPTSDVPYYYPNAAAIGAMRGRLAEIGWRASDAPAAEGPSRLLILRRNDGKTVGRFLANEGEVVVALKERGFTPVYCEDYTCAEQARMFAACECVVGVQGAGLANSLYMPRGSGIVEIMPASEVKWHFAVLASHASLQYGMVLAETVRATGFRPESVRVDIEALVREVEAKLTAGAAGDVARRVSPGTDTANV